MSHRAPRRAPPPPTPLDSDAAFEADLAAALAASMAEAAPGQPVLPPDVASFPSLASSGVAASGPRLLNATGEENCFVNATVQALSRAGDFGTSLLVWAHSPPPCDGVRGRVASELVTLIAGLAAGRRAILSPASLRAALAAAPGGERFGLRQRADAGELLSSLLDAVAAAPGGSTLVDAAFGVMLTPEATCGACGWTARGEPYTQAVSVVQAAAVAAAAEQHPACDALATALAASLATVRRCAACGGMADVTPTSDAAVLPSSVAVNVAWESDAEPAAAVAAVVAALRDTLDVGVAFGGGGAAVNVCYGLRSAVVFGGGHYTALARPSCADAFDTVDDARATRVGGWADVAAVWERGRAQVALLCFEQGLAPQRVPTAAPVAAPGAGWIAAAAKVPPPPPPRPPPPSPPPKKEVVVVDPQPPRAPSPPPPPPPPPAADPDEWQPVPSRRRRAAPRESGTPPAEDGRQPGRGRGRGRGRG